MNVNGLGVGGDDIHCSDDDDHHDDHHHGYMVYGDGLLLLSPYSHVFCGQLSTEYNRISFSFTDCLKRFFGFNVWRHHLHFISDISFTVLLATTMSIALLLIVIAAVAIGRLVFRVKYFNTFVFLYDLFNGVLLLFVIYPNGNRQC